MIVIYVATWCNEEWLTKSQTFQLLDDDDDNNNNNNNNNKGFPCLGSSFFWFKKASTSLCLSKDKIKGKFGKNTSLTPTKILSKK